MNDRLIDRLRGKYKVGSGGIYGTRDFSGFIPPICEEAAKRIECLESELSRLAEDWEKEGRFLDNPHDDEIDRQMGRIYKNCARDLRKKLGA